MFQGEGECMKKLLYKSSILVLLCFSQIFYAPVMAYAATPAISNVSGTIQTGQVLSITGTNMVNEDKSNWNPFFQNNPNASGFEGTSAQADGFSPPNGVYGGTYVTNVKLMGNQSNRFHVAGSCSSVGSNLVDYLYFGLGGATDIYARTYIRYHTNVWPGMQMKIFLTVGTSEYVIGGEGGFPNSLAQYYDGASHTVYLPGQVQFQQDRWYSLEVHWKASSPAHVTVWLDGTQVHDAVPTSTVGMSYWLFGIVNTCGFSNIDMYHWEDGLALSSTRVYPASKIEISNNATYGAGTLVYQEPVYLSDGSIQIKVNLSGIGSGPYYLWVTNNSQARSTVYPLGGISGAAVPLPPTLLSVQ